MDNIDLLILLGIFGVVTYVLCQYFYNKGFDEGSKYTSRIIGVSSVDKKAKKWVVVRFLVIQIIGGMETTKTSIIMVSG